MELIKLADIRNNMGTQALLGTMMIAHQMN